MKKWNITLKEIMEELYPKKDLEKEAKQEFYYLKKEKKEDEKEK
jgi:hypothetical protein